MSIRKLWLNSSYNLKNFLRYCTNKQFWFKSIKKIEGMQKKI